MHQVLVIAGGILLALFIWHNWRSLLALAVRLLLIGGVVALAMMYPDTAGGLMGVGIGMFLIVSVVQIAVRNGRWLVRREQQRQIGGPQ